MKLDQVCKKQDEYYTPQYAIDPILKYIPTSAHVLCPFDTHESYFVQSFTERMNKVSFSHIIDGIDFFEMERPEVDYVVSNPPYSMKAEVFERLFEWGIPFAMLVGVVGLFESQRRFDMFKGNDFEVMYLSRRVSYFESYTDTKPKLNPPFSSVYITHKVLPHQIVFEEIIKQ
jgi:hypothetical protein